MESPIHGEFFSSLIHYSSFQFIFYSVILFRFGICTRTLTHTFYVLMNASENIFQINSVFISHFMRVNVMVYSWEAHPFCCVRVSRRWHQKKLRNRQKAKKREYSCPTLLTVVANNFVSLLVLFFCTFRIQFFLALLALLQLTCRGWRIGCATNIYSMQ